MQRQAARRHLYGRRLFAGQFIGLARLLLTEIGIAKTDEGQAVSRPRRQAAQAGQRCHRGQLRHGHLPHQPGHLTVTGENHAALERLRRWRRHQQGKWQLTKLAMGHGKQRRRPLQQFGNRPKQVLIEAIGQAGIEGRNLFDGRCLGIECQAQAGDGRRHFGAIGWQHGKTTAPVSSNGPDMRAMLAEIPGQHHFTRPQHFAHLCHADRRRIDQSRIFRKAQADFLFQPRPCLFEALDIGPYLGLDGRQLLFGRG